MSSFQGVGSTVYRGVLISGSWNRKSCIVYRSGLALSYRILFCLSDAIAENSMTLHISIMGGSFLMTEVNLKKLLKHKLET